MEIKKEYNKNDEFYTPEYAIYGFEKFIDKLIKTNGFLTPREELRHTITIWCPFDTEESHFVKYFRKCGFIVVHSHIKDGKDFFEYEPEHWDVIVSNPPFSEFTNIVKKLKEFNKPFILLSNFARLIDKRKFMREQNCSILIPQRRIKFISENNYTPSATCWLTNVIKNQIVYLKEEEDK